MISLISFKKDLIIERSVAEVLGLKHTPTKRLGFHDDELKDLANHYTFKEDCIEKDGKYYTNQENLDKDKPTENYWMATKYTGHLDYVFVAKSGHLVNLISFAPKCKYHFFITESIPSADSSANNIELIFNRLEEKSAMLENIVDKIKDNTFNSKTNVHVGGGLITTYNDLLLKENVCTDVLQEKLNNGWRIIAVCVQPDQRRPDYILGRYNPTMEVDDNPNAKR